jgi:UDP-N-acetylglucosamine 2-epimerase
MGTNQVVGTNTERITRAAFAALDAARQPKQPPRIPPLWDGHTAERILDAIQERAKGEEG